MPKHVLLAISILTVSLSMYSGAQTRNITNEVVRVDADSLRDSWHAVLADDDAARVYCAWSQREAHRAVIRVALLSPGKEHTIRHITIPQPGNCEDVRPALACLGSGVLLVAWQRGCAGSRRIVSLLLDSLLQPLGEVTTVAGKMNPVMPSAGSNHRGEALLAWQDFRNGNFDVYARRYDREGTPMNRDLRVNNDDGAALQGPPRVARDNRDDFIVLWPDNREDGKWKFYAQRIEDDLVGTNMLVDSAQRKAMTTLASAVRLTQDSAVFAWKDYREDHSNIYRRRADVRIGECSPAERINDDSTARWQRLVVIDSDGRGNAVSCWEDYRNTEINQRGDIYLQPFARDGSFLGVNQKVNTRNDRIARKMPGITMLSDGSFLVIWHQGEVGAFNLYGQWYRYPAVRIGGNFCLTCNE